MQPIYSTNGEWVALLQEGRLYDTLGEWIAWLDGKDIYNRDGAARVAGSDPTIAGPTPYRRPAM